MVWPIKLLRHPNRHDATLRSPWKRHFGQPPKAPRQRARQVPNMAIGRLGHRQKAVESGKPRTIRLLLLLLFKGSTK
jgi:hypothetical protein